MFQFQISTLNAFSFSNVSSDNTKYYKSPNSIAWHVSTIFLESSMNWWKRNLNVGLNVLFPSQGFGMFKSSIAWQTRYNKFEKRYWKREKKIERTLVTKIVTDKNRKEGRKILKFSRLDLER